MNARRFLWGSALALGVLLAVPGGRADEKPAVEGYDALLKRVKSGDKDADFGRLRMAYAESPRFDPYGGSREKRTEMVKAFQADEFRKVVDLAAGVLEKNYTDIDAHLISHLALQELNKPELSAFHRWVADGLIQSILASGDGRSTKTAYVVISTDEEYVILNVIGLAPKSQALINDGPHRFDQFDTVDPEKNAEVTLFFNIDIPYAWLSKSMDGAGRKVK